MELKEGMFIRFKDKQGIEYIRKIKNIYLPEDISYRYGEIKIDKFNHNTNVVSRKNILKASHNIIDLIEVGDTITYKFDDIQGHTYAEDEKSLEIIKTDFKEENIKSIVTSQQFSAMEYRLGDE